MARLSINDAAFGELHWKEDRWLGAVAIPYFTGAGDEVVNPLRDEVLRPWGGSRSNAEALAKRGPEQPSPDPFDDENLFREAKFRIGGVDRDRPQSLVRWRHAHGNFGGYFYVIEPGAGPDDRQVAAWEAFNDDKGKNVATLLSALFEQYQKKWASASFDRVIVDPIQSRREYIDETCPRIDRIEGLRDLIELDNVYVHPADKNGSVRIVFQLHGSYEPEMMVLWRDGAIERFGKWPDRLPGSAH